MSKILSSLVSALSKHDSVTCSFDYKDQKTNEDKHRVIRFVNNMAKEYENLGTTIKGSDGKGNWVAEAKDDTDRLPSCIFVKDDVVYVRGFPTAKDASGAANHEKVFKVERISNFNILPPSTIKETSGDLLALAKEGKFDVIAHGCNCFCTMGSGIAGQMNVHFPEAVAVDLLTQRGDKRKLGNVTVAHKNGVTIVNCYTQFDFGYEGNLRCDYDAIRSTMALIKGMFKGKRIGLPLIGCGLAGGDWNKVSQIIADELEGEDVTVVHYKP